MIFPEAEEINKKGLNSLLSEAKITGIKCSTVCYKFFTRVGFCAPVPSLPHELAASYSSSLISLPASSPPRLGHASGHSNRNIMLLRQIAPLSYTIIVMWFAKVRTACTDLAVLVMKKEEPSLWRERRKSPQTSGASVPHMRSRMVLISETSLKSQDASGATTPSLDIQDA